MKIRHFVLALAAVAILGAAGYGLYLVGMNRGMKMVDPPSGIATPAGTPGLQAGAIDPATSKKVLYWHDPMVPGQKFDKPGKSPFMDMQLVPVYADGDGDQGNVSISSRVQQNLGVRTAEVTMGTLAPAVEAVGSVAYNERDVVVVQARNSGFVEKLYVRAPLDPVRKGQPLAELYVPEWVAAQEEYLAARRMAGTQLEALVDGARQRMRLVGMTEDQIRLIEASGKMHARLTLSAPIGGVVTELGAREGMTVMAGATLFRINGLTTVWVNAEVPETLAAQVRPGNPVETRAPAVPGTTFKGRINAILPEVNPATRTLKVRVELANPGNQLVPGMFATVNLAPAAGKEMLLVPTEAVIQTGTRTVVIVAESEGRFVPVDVETGIESGGRTEIRKGLEAGQKVVVSGQFLIDSEASLKGTVTRMGEMPASENKNTAGLTHRGEGKVERIGKDEITLSHGPIPSLQWGPMTMGFKLPAGLPGNFAVGDSVAFEIRQTRDGMYEIVTISPLAATSPQPMTGNTTGNMNGSKK
ncbi:MAG TPA: efflux RND transporter periplasmic adaptor subunit [Burkholderiales bacterium]|jgi:Cu(I)/Ag(I) efflux system membrane fusion protein|nr:efflux RND transporter periplasmic adaptor subunit [Burkholderiales bacterium]